MSDGLRFLLGKATAQSTIELNVPAAQALQDELDSLQRELAAAQRLCEGLRYEAKAYMTEMRAALIDQQRLRRYLQEIARRLDSASAEVDCFNVYESRALAHAALKDTQQGGQ